MKRNLLIERNLFAKVASSMRSVTSLQTAASNHPSNRCGFSKGLLGLAALTLVASFTSTAALAVVDISMSISYPSMFLSNSDDRPCLAKQTMIGSVGIVQPVYLAATFAPVQMSWVNYDLVVSQREDNYLAESPKALFTDVSDQNDVEPVPLSEVVLDLRPLRMSQSKERASDVEIVKYAKIALVSMAKNLAAANGNQLFKLKVNFIGLPSKQQSGSVYLPAQTNYPFTATSALFSKIEKEVFPASASCK